MTQRAVNEQRPEFWRALRDELLERGIPAWCCGDLGKAEIRDDQYPVSAVCVMGRLVVGSQYRGLPWTYRHHGRSVRRLLEEGGDRWLAADAVVWDVLDRWRSVDFALLVLQGEFTTGDLRLDEEGA